MTPSSSSDNPSVNPAHSAPIPSKATGQEPKRQLAAKGPAGTTTQHPVSSKLTPISETTASIAKTTHSQQPIKSAANVDPLKVTIITPEDKARMLLHEDFQVALRRPQPVKFKAAMEDLIEGFLNAIYQLFSGSDYREKTNEANKIFATVQGALTDLKFRVEDPKNKNKSTVTVFLPLLEKMFTSLKDQLKGLDFDPNSAEMKKLSQVGDQIKALAIKAGMDPETFKKVPENTPAKSKDPGLAKSDSEASKEPELSTHDRLVARILKARPKDHEEVLSPVALEKYTNAVDLYEKLIENLSKNQHPIHRLNLNFRMSEIRSIKTKLAGLQELLPNNKKIGKLLDKLQVFKAQLLEKKKDINNLSERELHLLMPMELKSLARDLFSDIFMRAKHDFSGRFTNPLSGVYSEIRDPREIFETSKQTAELVRLLTYGLNILESEYEGRKIPIPEEIKKDISSLRLYVEAVEIQKIGNDLESFEERYPIIHRGNVHKIQRELREIRNDLKDYKDFHQESGNPTNERINKLLAQTMEIQGSVAKRAKNINQLSAEELSQIDNDQLSDITEDLYNDILEGVQKKVVPKNGDAIPGELAATISAGLDKIEASHKNKGLPLGVQKNIACLREYLKELIRR